jgi:hypothetical protein
VPLSCTAPRATDLSAFHTQEEEAADESSDEELLLGVDASLLEREAARWIPDLSFKDPVETRIGIGF